MSDVSFFVGSFKSFFTDNSFVVAQVKKGSLKQKKKVKNLGQLKKLSKPLSLIDDKLDWNGTLFPFRGTIGLYDDNIEENVSDFDDSEWLDEPIKQPVKRLEIKNALGDLMSAYNSDDELQDEVVLQQNIDENKGGPNNGADDDAPIEVKISREPEQYANENNISQVSQQQESSNKNKKRRRKLKHAKSDVPNKKSKVGAPSLERNFIDQPFRKRKVTLLEQLLDSEIRHERNVLLQCVRFVVESDYFRKK